jgi:hypothetical protein
MVNSELVVTLRSFDACWALPAPVSPLMEVFVVVRAVIARVGLSADEVEET